MERKYLIDSNAIIDFFNGKLPDYGRDIVTNSEPSISIITFIELFSSNKTTPEEDRKLSGFTKIVTIHPITFDIAAETISLRKKYKIKLPDAIIAATAMNYKLPLITRNVSDFAKIESLELINPHK